MDGQPRPVHLEYFAATYHIPIHPPGRKIQCFLDRKNRIASLSITPTAAIPYRIYGVSIRNGGKRKGVSFALSDCQIWLMARCIF
jgi:hypothetical protein